ALDVLGNEDKTMVTVTSAPHIVAGPGVTLMNPGDMQNFMVNEGDVLQLETTSAGDDVSGSFIVSDKPVALFTGIECGVNPNSMGACDHVEEQILPLTAWGKNYVASRIALSSESAQAT